MSNKLNIIQDWYKGHDPSYIPIIKLKDTPIKKILFMTCTANINHISYTHRREKRGLKRLSPPEISIQLSRNILFLIDQITAVDGCKQIC